MDKIEYTQKHFKMHCCFCDQKILVEDKKAGELFDCPACKKSVTTPDYLKEAAKMQKGTSPKEPSKQKVLKMTPPKVKHKRKIRTSSNTAFSLAMLLFVVGTFYYLGKDFIGQHSTEVKVKTKAPTAKVIKPVKSPEPQQELPLQVNDKILKEEVPKYKQALDLITSTATNTGSLISQQELKLLVTKLKTHCYDCHGNEKHEEELNFEEMLTKEDFFKNYVHFKNSLDYISSKEMPPADAGEINSDEIEQFTGLIEKLLYTIEAGSDGKTGPVKLRRLNAKEYDNTVSSITGVNFNLSKNYNINNLNDASVLSLEGFIEAAKEISLHAKYSVEKGFIFSQDLPEFQRLSSAQEIENLELSKRKILSSFYFSDFSYPEAISRSMKALFELKSTKKLTQEILESTAQKYGLSHYFLTKAHKYFNSPARSSLDRIALQAWQSLNVKKDKDPQAAIEHFLKKYHEAKENKFAKGSLKARINKDFTTRIEALFKFSIAKLQSILPDKNMEDYLAYHSLQDVLKKGQNSKFFSQYYQSHSQQFKQFLSKLYRRPASPEEINEFSQRFADLMVNNGLEAATRIIITQSFISLKFLYLYENKKTENSQLNAYELASRVSYFLWDSPPDEKLMTLAENNSILKPEVLVPHIQEMIHDERFQPFIEKFTDKWLDISALKNAEKDAALKKDMYDETQAMVDYVFRNDEKLTRIINSDYTFLNMRLARHYGIEGDFPSTLVKTTLPENSGRGSILSHASILTATSSTEETNPVIRGNFILNNILGMSTPPPPSDAGTLEEKNIQATSKKEAFAKHRDMASCKGCHLKIDPLGFPLENYDVHGKIREGMDNVGEMASGKKLTGLKGLKKHIMNNKDAFLKNIAAKLFSEALGRGLYYYDFYIINRCLENLRRNDYRFSSVIATIVLSHQFQNKF